MDTYVHSYSVIVFNSADLVQKLSYQQYTYCLGLLMCEGQLML